MSLIHPTQATDITTANLPMILVLDGVPDGLPDAVLDRALNELLDGKTPCDVSL
jgi:hypothetical protein